ncbi:MAG: LPXTG cell wall anchor domain-containing protein [Candidatus Thorarchaeota archaeon]
MMLSGGGLPGLTGDSNLLVIGILGGVVAISVVAIVIFMKKRNTGV